MVVDTEVFEVKLWGSSIWHNRVLEVTRKGLRKQRYRKATESWAGPENNLRLLLSSFVLSSGLGTRLGTRDQMSARHLHILGLLGLHVKSKAITNQIVSLHATACCCSSLLHSMHCLLRLTPHATHSAITHY